MTRQDIFDHGLLKQRLASAAIRPHSNFLVEHAAREICDRIGAVLRPLSIAADTGAPNGIVSAFLRERGYDTQTVCLVPALALAMPDTAAAVGKEELLPLKPAAFDLITSLLSLQFANDLPGALIQIRRALRPDGVFAGALLGGGSLTELRQAFLRAEEETLGGSSPRVFPTVDLRDLGALLQRVGFALPVVDSEQLTVSYTSPLALMRELKSMGAANALVARLRTPLTRTTLARACDIYAETANSNGRVTATFEILYVSGWAS